MNVHWAGVAVSCGAIILITAALATAQDSVKAEDYFAMDLETLLSMKVTTASKRSQTVSEAPSNITIVTDRQIREWGVRNIKDLMRRVVGTPVIADRDEWVFAFRGNVSDNNQKYLMLIDGHRMNSIENFGPGQIIEMPNNLSSIKRVEIIRGPGSAVWGPDALAGVVNIITKTPEDLGGDLVQAAVAPGMGFDGFAGGGNDYRNSGTGDFQVGKKLSENVEFMLMGAGGFSEGEKVVQSKSSGFPKNLITPDHKIPVPDSPGDSATVPGTYETAMDLHRFGYMLHFKARAENFLVNAFAFSTETHNRHYEYGAGRENYLTTYKAFVEGGYDKAFDWDGNLSVRLSSGINRAEYQPGETDDTVTARSVNIEWLDRGFNASVDLGKKFGSVASINGSVDFAYTKVGPNHRIDSFSVNLTPDSARADATIRGYWFDPQLEDYQFGGYLLAEIKPLAWFCATGGVRFDYNAQRGSDKFNVNPRAALLFFPHENTTLKGMYNRGYLRPANFQSAYVKDSVVSETMDQVDLVWMQRFGNVSFAVNGYWQRLEGFISLLPGNAYNFRNVGDYQSLGVELDAKADVGAHEIWGNFYYSHATAGNFDTLLTYNSRRVDLDGHLLSYPPIGGNVGVTLRFLKGALWASPHVRVAGPMTYRTASVLSQALDDESFYEKTDPMVYVNLGLGWDINKYVGVSMYLDNILDERSEIPMAVWNGTVQQTGFEMTGKVQVRF